LVNEPSESSWCRYIAEDHELEKVIDIGPDGLKIQKFLSDMFFHPRTTLIQFVAEPGKLNARYDPACSLIWRDAAALVAYFAIVAQAPGLAFLPLAAQWSVRRSRTGSYHPLQ